MLKNALKNIILIIILTQDKNAYTIQTDEFTPTDRIRRILID